ncbi:MAG: Rne/Rng family ribonuclease [Alphaproteobacteria bacterium]|nr:Rne/Rng family ribonuclease [Alphaproteobacteria bacterium]
MAKRMLIDATHREETRIAVVSGKRLEDFDFETSTKKPIKGNIYLAKVTRVEPSLQAAFVDYGGNRHGFLAFSEIHPDYYRIPIADRAALTAAQQEEDEDGNGADEPNAEDGNGVEVVGGDDMEEIEEIRPSRRRPERRYKIQEVIKKRQILLVQVTKEERGTKGAALTTYLSLAGRYCVLMPNTTRGGGISRKVTSQADRKRLKSIMESLEIPDGIAIILRTAGVSRSKAEIRRDYDYLTRLWNDIREATLKSTAPALIYEEGNIIKRAIRDLYTNEISEVLVEGDDGYRAAKDFMRMLIPSHAKRVKKYKDPSIPMFHRYQVESQIDAIHSPTVRLKSGGYIVLDSAEALVAIDVNSGRATRERNIEETAHKTNLEAAEEIARQLRLRDLAGLIVIDFIDMDEQRNNNSVERRLKEAMRSDRARIQVGRISAFGLLELSRQRLRPSLIEASTETCPSCHGSGVIRSTESAALHVLRHLEEEGIRRGAGAIEVFVPEKVDTYLLNQKRHSLNEIEQRFGLSALIFADPDLVRPELRIQPLEADGDEARASVVAEPEYPEEEAQPRERGRGRGRRRRAKEAEDAQEAPAEEMLPAGEAEDRVEPVEAAEEEGARKRRRRGKRGGRRRARREQTAAAAGEAAAAEGEVEAVEEAADEVAAAEAMAPEEEAAEPAAKPVAARRGRRRAKAASEEAPPPAAPDEPLSEPTAEPAEASEMPEVSAEAEAKPQAKKPRSRQRKTAPRRRRTSRAKKTDAETPAVEAEALETAVGDSAEITAAPSEPDVAPAETAEASSGNGGSGARRRRRPTKKAVEQAPAPDLPIPPVPDAPAPATVEADKPRRGWWRNLIE